MQLENAKPAIDLTRFHFKRELGDITIFGTWLYNNEDDDSEPCLVLLPTFRHRGVKPPVIALSAAHRYNDARYLAQSMPVILQSLGFQDSLTQANRIAELIHSHLPDLVAMPNDPTEAVVVGHANIYDQTGSKTVEVIEHAQKAQV